MPPPALLPPNCATLVTQMPTIPEIVPALLMPPEKVLSPWTSMPSTRAEILPELVIPPPALLLPNWVTSVTLMPSSPVAEIVPALLIPPLTAKT